MHNSYLTSHNTSTLPRHPGNLMAHQWPPSYGGSIAGVRNITSIPVNGSHGTIVPPPPSTIAMQHLGPNGRPRIYQQSSLIEDEHATVETPLMMKMDSTV